ncbi:MAG: hypothetical protein ACUVSQ_01115 [Pseudanabaenaceae cyanobacterium]
MWVGIEAIANAGLGLTLPWRPVLAPADLAYGCHRGQMPQPIAELAESLQKLCPAVCRRVAIERDWLNLYLSEEWAIAAWRQLPQDDPPAGDSPGLLSLPAYAHAHNCSLLRLAGPPPQVYDLAPLRPLVGALLAAAHEPTVPQGEALARQCLRARDAYPQIGRPVLDGLVPACWVLQKVFGPLPHRL